MVTMYYRQPDDADIQEKALMMLPRQIQFTNKKEHLSQLVSDEFRDRCNQRR